MLEFAREQYLWLFALVALFFVVFFFARRWKKARVTYGFIWERVAKRTRPPTWKRLLRLILTLLISGAMLSSAALYASGLGPAKEQEPAPLLIFIVIDNSPSMRAYGRGVQASWRAQAIVDAMNARDRALVIHFERAKPVAGRWIQRGDRLPSEPLEGPGAAVPTDFPKFDFAALAELFATLGPPPEMPELPRPEKIAFWLGDEPPSLKPGSVRERHLQLAPTPRWRSLGGIPAAVETFGQAERNDGVVSAVFEPASPGTGLRGWVTVKLRSGYPAFAFMARDLDIEQLERGSRFAIPLSERRVELVFGARVVESPLDALRDDDNAKAVFDSAGLTSVLVCHSPNKLNPLLVEGLQLLLPGREIRTLSIASDSDRVEADLVVLDQVATEAKAKFVLCFGALPPSLGEVLPVREAKAGLFDALEKPEWLGFEIPNLQLLAGREAYPLKPGHKLTPLATHVEAGLLVAASRGERDVLYIGYSPTQSNFLFVPEGPTLLQRWLNAVQGRERMIVPPFCRMDQSVEIKLDSPAPLRVKLIKGWPDVIGATEYDITPSPDGRAKLGPFEQPGEYSVTQGGRELGRMAVYWVDEAEQALPYTPLEPLDLTKLAPVREHSWLDWFPEILLWIALCGLLLEWLLWLAGWTD